MNLNNIIATPLRRISTPGGDVMHALKFTDPCFLGFGEVYFSWVKARKVKAWKCHNHMTLNLVVPLGEVKFVFHMPGQKEEFLIIKIGEKNYARLTVPPKIWFGFQGIASGQSLLMNLADKVHDPDEVSRKSESELHYNWSLK